jgi:hypothetical protein
VPPAAARVWEYALFTSPPESDAEVIDRAGPMIIARTWVAVWAVGVVLSVALIVKVNVPAVVGVPEMVPPAVTVRPVGRDPAEIAQV